jgi:hypothetical protein
MNFHHVIELLDQSRVLAALYYYDITNTTVFHDFVPLQYQHVSRTPKSNKKSLFTKKNI